MDRIYPTSEEITSWLEKAECLMSDSAVSGLSLESQFDILYNAAYALSFLVLRINGERLEVRYGHHKKLFEALKNIPDAEFSRYTLLFNKFRKKRHKHHYVSDKIIVTSLEIIDFRETIIQFRKEIILWLKQHHSNLVDEKLGNVE